jgi:peptidoglycan hydrolase-like protein with peptidoglycan-binding domain
MQMKVGIVILLLSLVTGLTAGADQTIKDVQQALKDQGFYFGQVTGETNADTTAAIRRYQIRNGLEVTGELNEETLRSIKSSSSTAPSPSVPAQAVVPSQPYTAPSASSPNRSESRDRSDQSPESDSETPVPAQPFVTRPSEPEQLPPERGEMAAPPENGLFAGTPYAGAPIEVQRRVIIDAQRMLAQRGLYRSEIDGIYGPALEFSLRAYQSRIGLPVTGKFDLETLAALRLLPGAHTPGFAPGPGRFPPGPPVRGEWVRP